MQLQKNKTRTILIIILVAGLMGTCILSIVCVTPFILTAIRIAAEREPAAAVLTEYMTYMASKDVASAFALFSPHMQEQTPYGYMENLVDGYNFTMFSGFQDLSIDMLTLANETSSDPMQPQGSTAHVSGKTTYSDGYTGEFVAILEKVDGEWMIYSMTVTVPQDKGLP